MQFSTIWGEVASNFPTANQSRAKMAVNWAYHEFLSARQWSFRETSSAVVALVAGTSRYTLIGTTPVITDFDGMIDVILEITAGGDQKPLTEMLQPDFDRVAGHSRTNGDPILYSIQGGAPGASSAAITQGGQQQLVLAPPPVATAGHGVNLILRYFRSVASMEMSADTDIPLLPAQYHPALVVGGNSYLAEAIGSQQKALMWRQLFEKRIAEAVSSDLGMRGRDRQLLVFQPGASIYPITGQSPTTTDLSTRPYDKVS